MNVWVAFFLVLAVVVLTSPFLKSGRGPHRNGKAQGGGSVPDEQELQPDIASDRLSGDDYRAMTGQRADGLYRGRDGMTVPEEREDG